MVRRALCARSRGSISSTFSRYPPGPPRPSMVRSGHVMEELGRHRRISANWLAAWSNLELDTDFHDPGAWDFEIHARPLSVMMHEGENLLAPSCHASTTSGRNNCLVAGVVGRSPQVAAFDLVPGNREVKAFRHIRLLHEAEAQLHPGELFRNP